MKSNSQKVVGLELVDGRDNTTIIMGYKRVMKMVSALIFDFI
jgi:hypothetical protein